MSSKYGKKKDDRLNTSIVSTLLVTLVRYVRGKGSIGTNINSMELEREKGIHTFVSAPAVVSVDFLYGQTGRCCGIEL
jgi:hypothetical protein